MSELRVALGELLAWGIRNLEQFEIKPSWPLSEKAKFIKPVAELALTGWVLSRSTDSEVSEKGKLFIDASWEYLLQGELIMEVLEEFPDLLILFTSYVPFKRCGIVNNNLEETVRRHLDIEGYRLLDLPAWRALDLNVALEQTGMTPIWESQELANRTWLYGMPEPWTLSESSAYSTTHTVFYLTDFGKSPLGLSKVVTEYLLRWSDSWQAYFMKIGNLDLLSEFIMVDACLGKRSPLGSLKEACKRRNPDGSVPSPEGAGGVMLVNVTDEQRRMFLHSYHTTLVTIMALSMVDDLP